jgi:transposase-like protein
MEQEASELKRLRSENKRLQMENDILKKPTKESVAKGD